VQIQACEEVHDVFLLTGTEMLTKMSRKCDQKTMNVSGRHKSADANALHQEENNTMHTQRNKLLHFTDPNEDKQKKKCRKSRPKSKKSKKKCHSSVAMVQAPVAAPTPPPVVASGSMMDQMFNMHFKSAFEKKMAEMMGAAQQSAMIPGGTASAQSDAVAAATAQANPIAAAQSGKESDSSNSELGQ